MWPLGKWGEKRGGGEVTCDRSLIEKIVPDEVPYTEPAGEQPLGTTGTEPAAAQELIGGIYQAGLDNLAK